MSFTLSLGARSSGTLRTVDLLEAFEPDLDDIARVDPSRVGLRDEVSDIIARLNDGEDVEDAEDVLDEVYDVLNEYAPPFCYAGSIDGDGSCIGVFFSAESMDEAARCGELVKVEAGDPLPEPGDHSYVAFITDHGNVTICDAAGAELVSCV